jgi:hypothetical protein
MHARALPLALVLGGLALIPASAGGAAKTSGVRKTASGTMRVRRHREEHRLLVRSPRARASIVGGSLISIEQAPWQVGVFAFVPEVGILLCGGSILDSTRILTAAHCTYNPETEAPLPAGDFLVVAGTSNLAVIAAEEQESEAVGVRRHPYYSYTEGPGSADDVAVIELKEALSLSGSSAKSIGLVTAGATPPEGTSVNLTGYGREAPKGSATGELHSLGMTLAFSRRCGGEADALFLCASTPSGSLCNGDSGSGLTKTGSPVTLVGVTDTVEVISGEACLNGAIGGFVNVAAPEIKDFIEGSEIPPRAPRGGGAIIEGVLTPGHTLTCEPGSWSNSPTITIAFVDSTGGQTLQSGTSSTYSLSAADVGRTILCEVQATNAGGTGIGRTGALPPIEGGPQAGPPTTGAVVAPRPLTVGVNSEPGILSLASTSTVVQDNRVVALKLKCTGGTSCAARLTLTAVETVKTRHGKKKTSRTVTIGTATPAFPVNSTGTVKISLNAAGRRLLAAAHGRLIAKLTIHQVGGSMLTKIDVVRLVGQAERSSKKSRK